ncbi:pyridoxamine 5'-phosphate oxidase family protein [Nocardioides sp. CFH 31398]|uniref:pyridoxamine 5'-phosphate oxidase family protein n=1 Tax=Nocardioides sp. CFH 31398 TaxID=2919579 RepID=UPI001F05A684|nr:pyridoxamine 5'-phosphate oxidase family protein [Nocardioides sp. CFH 31398]MCH1866115.1 pyridoxamine 5'-phosphate oxidase family protein [Nocardioides sp. CFH 31398]
MSTPRTEAIPRTGRGTGSEEPGAGPATWAAIETDLRAGAGTSWLSVPARHGGVHTRPVFAAWGGSSFVVTTSPAAVKTAHLRADGRVSLAVDLGTVHLVVEARAVRLHARADLERASAAMLEAYDWPTEPTGDLLDAPYAAPTSGGPPFEAWELHPRRAHAFPTADQVQPTRFVFDGPT